MKSQYWSLLAFVLIFSCQKKQAIVFPDYFPQTNRIYLDSVRRETIELGEKLFFDTRLSSNNKVSCATCHKPELAFTDGEKISKGFEGRFSLHNSSTLMNVGFSPTFMFDMRSHSLELQPMLPIQDSNEMQSSIFDIERKLSKDATYQAMAKKCYGTPLTIYAYNRALAAYMKSLISANSRFDDYLSKNDSSVFTEKELKGKQLFFGKGNCNQCHVSPLFTNHLHYNIGLEDSLTGMYGKFRTTHKSLDRGRFKTPTLRNIEITFPYFHDGRCASLEEALNIHLDPNHITYDYVPASLSNTEKVEIIQFLKTLTDKNLKKTPYLQSKSK